MCSSDLGANIVSHAIQIGDRPQMEKLIGTIKVMLDGYVKDRFDRVLIAYTRFINTMKQEPVIEQLLPVTGEKLGSPDSVRGIVTAIVMAGICIGSLVRPSGHPLRVFAMLEAGVALLSIIASLAIRMLHRVHILQVRLYDKQS